MNHPNDKDVEMITDNINPTTHERKAETCPHCLGVGKVPVSALENCPWCKPHAQVTEVLMAEIKAFIAFAMTERVSIKEAADLLLKIENWEASK